MIKFKVFLQYPYLDDLSLIALKGKCIVDMMAIDPTYPLDIIRWTLEKCSDELRVNLENQQARS